MQAMPCRGQRVRWYDAVHQEGLARDPAGNGWLVAVKRGLAFATAARCRACRRKWPLSARFGNAAEREELSALMNHEATQTDRLSPG
jgi:hypothetical protein